MSPIMSVFRVKPMALPTVYSVFLVAMLFQRYSDNPSHVITVNDSGGRCALPSMLFSSVGNVLPCNNAIPVQPAIPDVLMRRGSMAESKILMKYS